MRKLFVVLACFGLFMAVGCGAAEKAGEKAKEGAAAAGEKVKEGAEAAKEGVKEGAEKVKEAVTGE